MVINLTVVINNVLQVINDINTNLLQIEGENPFIIMLTIKQSAELSFHHVDVKDAVIMADLMNNLACRIAERKAAEIRRNMPDDTRNLYRSIFVDSVRINAGDAEAIFNVLSAMGFVATEEYSIDDILAEHLKKD